MDEENMNPEEENTEPDPVVPPEEDPDGVVSGGMVPITDHKGVVLGHLKISSVSIDHKQGLVVKAEDVEVFGSLSLSVIKVDSLDLTYEVLQKLVSLTEGAEIWVE